MALTKKFFCEKAFAELGLAAYVYDMQPDDFQYALSSLNAMIGEWEGQGVQVGGFPVDADPDDCTELNTIVTVPASNWRAIWTNLAVMIAPNVGRAPEGPTIAYASQSFRRLLNHRVEIPEMQRPSTMPIGTGWNRGIKDRNFYHQQAQLTTGSGQTLDVDVWDAETSVQPIVNN